MPKREIEAWREFYQLYPFDDFHRFHRPAALIASSHPGTTAMTDLITRRLEWLAPKPLVPDFNDADQRTLAAFGMTPPPQFMKARTD